MHNFLTHITAALLFFGILLYRLTQWVLTTIGGVTEDQILFHIFTKTEGMPKDLSQKLFIEVGAKPLLAVGIFYFLIWIFSKFKLLTILLKISTPSIATLLMMAIIIKWNSILFQTNVSVEFINKYKSTDIFNQHYIKPEILKPPVHNLIWIYFESLEAKYVGMGESFKKTNNSFDGQFHSLSGTGWTMAGMVGSQCGVPLLPNPTATRGKHLKGAVCLSYLLKDAGYTNNFIGGAPLEFSEK